MTRQHHTQHLSTRVPVTLAEALRQRSALTGKPVAALVREGVAREALAPLEDAAVSHAAVFARGEAEQQENEP